MTDYQDFAPTSLLDAERELRRISTELAKQWESLAETAMRAAKADAAYKREHTKAYLVAEGAAHLREAEAMAACADLYEEKKIAEALLRADEEKGRGLRAQLEAVRSLGANAKYAVTTAYGSGW